MNFPHLEQLALEVVEAEKGKLPADIVRSLAPVQLRIMFRPDREMIEEGLDDLLGLFEGNSLLDGDPATPDDFPRITLFLQNLWDEAEEDEGLFRKEVRTTWLHEIGHYLGWGEDEVEARGLG